MDSSPAETVGGHAGALKASQLGSEGCALPGVLVGLETAPLPAVLLWQEHEWVWEWGHVGEDLCFDIGLTLK